MTASRSSRRHARSVAASALLTSVAALSVLPACSSGLLTQTGQQVAAVPGVNADAGPDGELSLRNVLITYNGPGGYRQGGSAPLEVRIFNDGETPAKLTRVTAPGAAQRVVLVGATGATQPPQVTTSPPAASPTAEATASPASGSPSPDSTPDINPPVPTGPTGQASFSIEIAPASFVVLTPRQGQYLQLVGLTRELLPGASVPVAFTFGNGTSVTVNMLVPMGVPTSPLPRPTPVAPEAEAGE